MSSLLSKTALVITLSGITALGGFYICKLYNRKNSEENETLQIIFFPDKAIACRRQFTERHGCTSANCKFSHDQNLSYAKLMSTISVARKSVDVCVFCLTCKELCEILTQLNEKGVVIRVITDSEQMNASGSQLGNLRGEGIQVRCDNTPYFMHHKFLILDGVCLLNGSFNWTRQAITGNFENICITRNNVMVSAFSEEFHRLWKLFDPASKIK